MKKNVGSWVQLVPIARRFDENYRELPPMDDDWIIREVATDGVRISNIRTDHVTKLGLDHIHHFTTNPDRSQTGTQHGFLTLNVQIFLQGKKLWVRPVRPGRPMKLDEIVELAEEGEEPLFLRLEKRMPELLDEMRKDLSSHPLSREFVILKRAWVYRGGGHELMYYFDDHRDLENKVRMLENCGLIRDITHNNTKRYIFTEALVRYLGA